MASSNNGKAPSQPSKDATLQPAADRIPMFFYGTLQSPKMLTILLDLAAPPILQKGTITGFAMKMWGPYPILVRQDAGKETTGVKGMVWEATASQFRRLEAYEGDTYTWCEVDVDMENGEIKSGVRVFVAKDAENEELEEGAFDLEEWERSCE